MFLDILKPRKLSIQIGRMIASKAFLAGIAGWAIVAASAPCSVAQARSCENLSGLRLPDVSIVAAAAIPSGWEAPKPNLQQLAIRVSVPFCRVQGLIEGSIGFEVWLPENWNGKLFSAAVGGYAGSIGFSGMAPALMLGYATSSTDTGHQGGGAEFMKENMKAVMNYGYRGVHLTAVTSKKIITAYYGKAPTHSYLCGCSGGGYAGLANTQRYPTDYDGVISGDPGTLFIHHAARAIWSWQVDNKGAPGYIPSEKDKLLWGAAVAACDAKDGVTYGLIENPLACKFDFSSIQCAAGTDANSCLTAPQVLVAKKLYGPMKDSSGTEIYPATAVGTPLSADAIEFRAKFYAEFWRDGVFENADWDPATFTVGDVAIADAKLGSALNSDNPDLTAFRDHGGKIILYHGWNDPGVSPLNSLEYYESVEKLLGDKHTHEFFTLFLVPGMYHCSGGPGPNTFDALSSLERWVEKGEVPDQIIASHSTGGKVDRTIPLCAYPHVAQYRGKGSIDDAANFSCVLPQGH